MKRNWRVIFAGLAFTTLTQSALAVGTRHFVLDTQEAFSKGDLKGVAVDYSGQVRAGFNLGTQSLEDVTTVWSVLRQPDGSLLVATGNEGRLLEVRQGQVKELAKSEALVLTSLVRGFGGAVFVGAVPSGKILRYANGKLETFATLPDSEHIWQLAYDPARRSLFAATGPEGKLWRVDQRGEAELFYDADEPHLVSLALDRSGTVYAGSSEGARLYAIEAPGRGRVVYDFGVTEVRALAIDGEGRVLAIANQVDSLSAIADAKPKVPMLPTATSSEWSRPKTNGKGALFRFDAGRPELLLRDTSEHFVSLAIGDDGQPFVGTGLEGRIYTVDGNRNRVLFADTEERQIGAMLFEGSQPVVAGSDPAVLHPVRGLGGVEAVWTSEVLDAGLRAHFGFLDWEASGVLEFSTRTGNTAKPDKTWGEWSSPLTSPTEVSSDPGRFLQVRARWNRDPKAVLRSLSVPFVTDNLRATITKVSAAFAAGTKSKGSSVSKGKLPTSGGPVPGKTDGKIKLSWDVDNPDEDKLRYRLEYRILNNDVWYGLEPPNLVITEEKYTWDTSELPEGRYRVRVTASDEISNPPPRATKHAVISSVILVDNVAPRVEHFRLEGDRLRGVAVDGVGPIQRIEVAVSGTQEWFPFFPADGIFDREEERFDIDLSALTLRKPGLLSLRIYDAANNFVVKSVPVR